MKRSASTISREVKRNSARYKPRNPKNRYWYHHWRAHALYVLRRRNQRRAALSPGTAAWDFIVEKLNKFWSPEAICGRWLRDFPDRKPLCAATIYRYIRKGKFPRITPKTHLRRRGKRSFPRSSNYNSIHPDRIIPDWPDVIEQRLRFGDWEGDTVYGAIGKGLLVTLVDRRSRFLLMRRISSRNANETCRTIVDMLKGFPVNSISLDNGAEFSEFSLLEKQLDTFVFFAEPHKPWQRGTNENTNDIVRFFFPKGTNFLNISDDAILSVQNLINSRPRKCLGWLSPAEFFASSLFFPSVALA